MERGVERLFKIAHKNLVIAEMNNDTPDTLTGIPALSTLGKGEKRLIIKFDLCKTGSFAVH